MYHSLANLRSCWLYPRDDSFWYHYRIAKHVSRKGSRQDWDDLSNAPDGRKMDSYPPLLHYLLGGAFWLLQRIGVGRFDYRLASLCGLLGMLTLGATCCIVTRGRLSGIVIMVILVTTPILHLRLGLFALRGEVLVVPLVPLVMAVLSRDYSAQSCVLLCGIVVWALSSSKTSMLMVESSLLTAAMMAASYDWAFVGHGISIIGALAVFRVIARGQKFTFPFSLILRRWRSPNNKRVKYPRVRGDLIITEEEMTPSWGESLRLVPSILPGAAALFLLGNFPQVLVWKLTYIYYLLNLSLGRRYLLQLAIPSTLLTSALFAGEWPMVMLFSAVNIYSLWRVKTPEVEGLYSALSWLSAHAASGGRNLVMAWWYHGHLISGFCGLRSAWDSYYPGLETFLEKERLLDSLIEGDECTVSFCKRHQAYYLLLDAFRARTLNPKFKCVWYSEKWCIFSLLE